MLKSTLIDVSALSIKPTPDYFMLKFTLEAKIENMIFRKKQFAQILIYLISNGLHSEERFV